MRTEQEIFSELEKLCSSSGYAHALSFLCFRDCFIKVSDKLKPEDVGALNSPETLCGNEISVLIGLMIKGDDYLAPIDTQIVDEMIVQSDNLMAELHEAITEAFRPQFLEAIKSDSKINPFRSGMGQREPIFYSAESAYDFQFRSFALEKYKNDNNWFLANKGYSIGDAVQILETLSNFQNENLGISLYQKISMSAEPLTLLPYFTFDAISVATRASLSIEIVSKFLNSFSCPENINNDHFSSIDDFNLINAYPLIKIAEDRFICFNSYSLAQAFYETPFFWMNGDKEYKEIAATNRGLFTEMISKSRLESVFGANRVFHSVLIHHKGKRDVLGEIDVLVLFGDRAIVLQAKSKKLTIKARKGNETALTKDFQLSVQESYNQGLCCSEFLLAEDIELRDNNGKIIILKHKIKEAYIICVVSDHYPALNFQSRSYLSYKDTDQISPPLITDVFFLDVLCEMLQSPLLLVSYLNRRLRYFEQVISSNEFAVLGYHLKCNLWLEENTNLYLHDDLATNIDIAMLSRRVGLQGETIPSGLLTKLFNPNLPLGKILKEIENKELPSIIEFGLLIFTFSEDTIKYLNNGIKRICTLARNDGRQHDFSIAIANTGITIHSNRASIKEASQKLSAHCALRKYALKLNTWFGLLLSGEVDFQLRNGLKLNYEHIYSKELEDQLSSIQKVPLLKDGKTYDYSGVAKKKLTRNDPCPCGSGLKYKKCCLP
jgi:hypothetical protein